MPDKKMSLVEALTKENRWEKEVTLNASKVEPQVLYGYIDNTGVIRRVGTVGEGATTDMVSSTTSHTVPAIPGSAPQISKVIGTDSDFPGTLYEILGIIATYVATAAVGNRVWLVSLYGTDGGGYGWKSDAVTSSANQTGTIWITRGTGGYFYLNDNATVTDSAVSNNPLPAVLQTGAGVNVEVTDNLEDDVLSLRVIARRLA